MDLPAELVPLDDLAPHPNNPNQGDLGAITASLALNGWWGTVVASRRSNGALVILAGEHRWRALNAIQEGFQYEDGAFATYDEMAELHDLPPKGYIPVYIRDGLDDLGEKSILLADNRTSDLHSYDDRALADLLVSMAAADHLAETMFDEDALNDLLEDLAPPQDYPPKPNREQTCPKCGHTWSP